MPNMTTEEFDALLEAYKVQNPKKYEEKEKSGYFDRFRATLSGKPKKKKKEKEEEPKEEEPEEEVEKPKAKKKKSK